MHPITIFSKRLIKKHLKMLILIKRPGTKTGQNFSVRIFEDGSFKAYGDDKYGQVTKINQYSDYSQVKQIELGWTHAVILLKSGKIVAFGRNDYGQISSQVDNDIKFSQISSG